MHKDIEAFLFVVTETLRNISTKIARYLTMFNLEKHTIKRVSIKKRKNFM